MRRWAELICLFILLPTAMALEWLPGAKLFWLLGAALGCGIWLAVSAPGGKKWRITRPGPLPAGMLWRIGVAAVVVTALTLVLHPERFLELPRRRTGLWLLIMALYPMLSAWPQEIIYRGFFFQRYAALFHRPWAMILASGAVFAYVHVIYANTLALSLSLVGGVLLSQAYARDQSLFWVTVEHAAYGLLVFTLGLGRYFYQGG
ncbi:CAAX protease self-immunity [Paucidesulfovibrio gracilis DSM 16080]|uniref:CAAX protease self-immunity n=2 Tax=Paucidesulfovibrio TaxID=2910985 RepID=A0A1T4XYU2_9BACT|nr:CAAX protease self-immunity [Paucidesulfovibrio gracilis DSM 16080]